MALFLGSIASLWVRKVFSGSFIVLLISAILFFGAYFVVLTIAKEPLIYQIEEGLLTKLKRKGKNNMYDYLVVGSRLYGAIFAHEAKKAGKSVLVVDKRPNIAGNIYTEKRGGHQRT